MQGGGYVRFALQGYRRRNRVCVLTTVGWDLAINTVPQKSTRAFHLTVDVRQSDCRRNVS